MSRFQSSSPDQTNASPPDQVQSELKRVEKDIADVVAAIARMELEVAKAEEDIALAKTGEDRAYYRDKEKQLREEKNKLLDQQTHKKVCVCGVDDGMFLLFRVLMKVVPGCCICS